MNPRLLEILDQQRASGFADVAGAHASATIPVSDRLVTILARENIPPAAPIRDLELRAVGGNRFTVRVRLSRPAWLPPIALSLAIEEQPQLPERPVLLLRAASAGGLMSFAGSAAKVLNVLPPGIQMDGDRIAVDLRTLLEQRGLTNALDVVEQLEVFTEAGRFVVAVRLRVPDPPPRADGLHDDHDDHTQEDPR